MRATRIANHSVAQECCFNIGSSSLVRAYSPIYGAWMMDPLETDGAGKIWAMPNYNGSICYEFASMADFIANNVSQSYTLPQVYDGTGHVVYGGYLYYNQGSTSDMIKYDISTQAQVLDVNLPGAGNHNTYHYDWGGWSDIDFAVDENGLWVLYATAANSGKMVISKLDTATLAVAQTWNTNSENKIDMGNAFMICGVLYCIDDYFSANTTINYKYNTWTSTGSSVSIPWNNVGTYMTQTDYDPNTGTLRSWTSANCYSYPVNFNALATTTTVVDVLCNGDANGTATITPTGGSTPYTYLWDANAGNQVTATATGLGGGTYVVTVTDNNNCYSIDTVTVIEPTALTSATSSIDVLCFGDSSGTATVTPSGGTGGFTYLWDANAGNQTDSTATGLSGGNYSVTVTDGNGCTHTTSVTVNSLAGLSLTTSVTNDVNSSCIGTATATPTGGTSPYSYAWDANTGNQTLQTATALCAGVYYVTVTDDNGCTVVDSATVNNVVGIDALADNSKLTVYPNPNHGSFTVTLQDMPKGNYRFEIRNVLGQVVYQNQFPLKSNLVNVPLNLGHLGMGTYTLSVSGATVQQTSKLFLQ